MGYIFSHQIIYVPIPPLPLNNYRNRKIFNVSVLPHQIVKMIKWTIKKKCMCMSLAKCEFPSQCALWAGACGTPSFLSSVSDTVVGCDLANQWFSQGSMFASLLIFPQGNKMSAVVSSFTSVFQIEENMWKETFAPLVRRENAFARVSGRYLLTYFTRALSDDQS